MPNIIEELQSIAAELETSPALTYDDFELVAASDDISLEFASVFEDR